VNFDLPNPITSIDSLKSFSNIYLYGFGHTGKRVHTILKQFGFTICGITDSHLFISDEYLSMPDIASQSAPNDIVLICSYNMTYAHQIYEVIRASAFRGQVAWNALDFPYDDYHCDFDGHLPTFQDKYSASLFGAILECFHHKSNAPLCDFKASHCVHSSGQYLDIQHNASVRSILDIGVFDGSELVNFWSAFPNLDHYTGIDPFGMLRLTDDARSCVESSNCRFLSVAVGDYEGTVQFFDEGPGSFITSAANTTIKLARTKTDSKSVELTTLDSLYNGGLIESVDYLKIDIEGGEIAALTGAAQFLSLHVKMAAISIYHKLEHLWLIPRLMARLGFSVQYIRSYTPSPIDTILYCYNERFKHQCDL
jgi:FkbM family methyltransferase